MYTEPDGFDAILAKKRDHALATFAKRIGVKVDMPMEEPLEVTWTDHEQKRNAFFIGVNKPNYAMLRAWTCCINSGQKIGQEVLGRQMEGAPPRALVLVGLPPTNIDCRNWSLWRVLVIAGQDELVEIATWMADLAAARINRGPVPPAPKLLGMQDTKYVLTEDHHQYHTMAGASAWTKDDPFPFLR